MTDPVVAIEILDAAGRGRKDESLNGNAAGSHTAKKVDDPNWPKLNPLALHGPVGAYVTAADPDTEADPVAVYMSALAGIGAILDPSQYVLAGNDRHPPLIWPVLVGDTAKAGKGTSWAATRALLEQVSPTFIGDGDSCRVLGGFSSGEALVDAVADGEDRRLLAVESEFARVLKVCARDGSILSQTLRNAWDGRRLEVRSRASTKVASGHHIVVVGHVTAEELRRRLDDVETYSGTANRILWACVRRSKRLPKGGNVPDKVAAEHGEIIRRAVEGVEAGPVRRTTAGEERWAEVYDDLGNDDAGGILGAAIARAEPYTLRLSLLLALLDGERYIDVPHVDAALAIWNYCRASAAWIWGDALGDPDADRLLAAIRRAGADGLDGTAQRDALGRHGNAAAARQRLADKGLVVTSQVDTGGRPATITVAAEHAPPCDQSARSDQRPKG